MSLTALDTVDVSGTGISMDFTVHARRLILFKIRIRFRNNMRYWIRYSSSLAMNFTMFECYPVYYHISLNLSIRFCIIDVIPRAES